MDAQHSYEISLKKDALFINLSSDDVYFISKQMDKWFRILLDDSYVPVALPQRPQPMPEPAPQAVVTPPPVVESPPEPVAPQPVAPPIVQAPVEIQPPPEPTPIVQQPQPLPVAEVLAPAIQEAPVPQPIAAVDLPPVMQAQAQVAAPPELSIVSATPALQPVAIGAPAETPKDDFESVMDTVMRDLETPIELRQPAFAPEPVYEEPSQPSADLSLISSLADLCDQANAGTSEDYLLLAAYYLNQMELQDSFSLKRINSNLVKSGLTPVNHSILEAVLSKGYLSMVPDMTGTAEVSEYTITQDGLSTVNRLF